MNNKLVYIIGGAVVVIGMFYIFSDSNEVKNPVKEKEIKIAKKEIVSSKPLKIEESFNKSSKVEKKEISVPKKISANNKIEEFIANNNLQSINEVGDMEIFASNPPRRDEFAPPMPPVMIKLKFKDKEEILPLNADLVNSNKEIYIVRKEGDEYKEIKAIDTKKLKSFTPPSIGQN